ncbi:hypothetical protein KHQ81_00160 [Mycoplasmatota bacterium]|nr:hypothetical protein KHQ81_00160 [Mycoplasmatota bacterium]
MRKKKINLGDIFSIPLPNGKFAFARLFKENVIAVYKKTYTDIIKLPLSEDYQFIVGVYQDLLQDGIWKVVDNRPFESEEDAWVRGFIKDPINGKYSMYYKGKIIPSTEEECKGLEQVAAWDRHHVVDRIMGDNKWNIS